ncbi:MAG: PilZ domain-containing protein [Bdellovibrionales bacterium]
MSTTERREYNRKHISGVEFHEMTSLSNYGVIANYGYIVDASVSGFLVRIPREALAEELKLNLNVESIVGQNIAMFLPQMNLDLDGQVIRGTHVGKGDFELAVEFSVDVPEYWRECLVDLLPNEEELEAFEKNFS